MKLDLPTYASTILWLARLNLKNDKRELTLFGNQVAVLEHPLSVNCPLNQNGARIISLHSNCLDAGASEDYVQLTLSQTPDHLSLHTPMYPRFYEVLTPLMEKNLRVKAFQFVDVPILEMKLKDVHRKSWLGEKIPFTIRVWSE